MSADAGATIRDTGASRGANRMGARPPPGIRRIPAFDLAPGDYFPGQCVSRERRSCKLLKISLSTFQ